MNFWADGKTVLSLVQSLSLWPACIANITATETQVAKAIVPNHWKCVGLIYVVILEELNHIADVWMPCQCEEVQIDGVDCLTDISYCANNVWVSHRAPANI